VAKSVQAGCGTNAVKIIGPDLSVLERLGTEVLHEMGKVRGMTDLGIFRVLGQIAATEEIIKIETESVDILHKQLALGQVAEADVTAVEATLAQAQAGLPPLQKQLAVERDMLTALLGRLPSQEPAETFELASIRLPQELPVSLPSKLVEQRPDVQSAEAQLHAASAEIGVAMAAILPQFNLTPTAGFASNQFDQLFMIPGTAFWTLVGTAA
jgi:outer membrane protein TolC